ncbi:GAF domain-containing SpoIIE family protein phosphatase [Paenibacillus koleovorans]|uniref:GAF domain-containing SpoIIE family protein phosphatase n=1 Tax=Paenibacillus koleovorans TaxID=121608 RepID=UPI0013E39DC9|nr:GAF domain-containing SpoIIE family protein phosphatase [Paenibacillus koleovorans]
MELIGLVALCLLLGLLVAAGAYEYSATRRQLKRHTLLVEVSMKLNSTIKKRELLQIMMSTLTKVMHAEGSSIILLDKQRHDLYFEIAIGEKGEQVKQIRLPMGEGIAGWVALNRQSVVIDDVKSDPRWSNRVATKTEFPTRNMMCVPVLSGNELIGVLQVINKKRKTKFTTGDLKLLEMIASPAAIALENAHLYEALEQSIQTLKETTAIKERMESELKIARDIQISFLPKAGYTNPTIELRGVLKPAREVGGDFYNFFDLDQDLLFFTLGDISDKGIHAAMFMAATLTLIKGKIRVGMTPAELLHELNLEVSGDDSSMFATIFCGILNTRTGELVYSNGGHCTPYILTSDARVEKLPGKGGIPIGVMEESVYNDHHAQIEPGSTIVLYTDGIIEAEDAQHRQFGNERLIRELEARQGGSVGPLVDAILRQVELFANGADQFDDIAVLAIQFKGNAG